MSRGTAPGTSAAIGPQQLPHTKPLVRPNPAGPIPTVVVGNPPSSVPSANTLNNAATAAQDTQAQIAAENALLRILYGRVCIGAQIADVLYYQGALVIVAVWGEAGAAGIQSIDQVYLDDLVPTAGVTITNYLGTQTTPDTVLAAAYLIGYGIPFADAFNGVAYSVIVLQPGFSLGIPRITATLKGLKVYDPRDGTQTLGTPSTYKYSDNPALCMADLETNAVYGAGGSIDWASVTAVANACDAIVAGVEKRRVIGLAIDGSQTIEQWREVLRAYAGCFVDPTGGIITLVPDRPASSTFTFNEVRGSTVNCRVRNVKRKSKRDVPTVVCIRWTDTSVQPWRERMAFAYAPGVQAGTVPWKMSDVAMPGIQRGTQAIREAIERLNKLTLNDLTLDIDGQDEALAVAMGDVVTVSANVGLTARQVRVLQPQLPEAGRPVFSCEGYDASAYSDSVTAAPSVVDTLLPNPSSLSPPTGLVITEVPYLERVGGSTLAGGMVYQTRFDVSWTAPASSFPVNYRVEVWDVATKIRDDFCAGTSYSTPPLQQGKTYTVKVYSRNTLTESTTALIGSHFATGKQDRPGPVPSITRNTCLAGKVILNWLAPADLDVMRFEWRYTPNQTVGGSWDTATFIDRVDGLGTVFQGLPTGTHRFYVRAVDSVGQYSTADCTVDLLVDSDPNALISSKRFTNPTLTNMVSFPMLEGVWKPRWVTSVAGDQFSTVEPSPLTTGANPLLSYGSNATKTWRSESWDLGSVVTGAFSLQAFNTVISGTLNAYIESSPDNVTFTRQPGFSWQGAARFVKVTFEALAGSTFRVDDGPVLSLAALTKVERFNVTTSATQPTLIALANLYATKVDLQITAAETTAARIGTYGRLLLYPQSGLMMTWTNSGVGAGDAFEIQNIFGSSRVIAAGDFLEYDVWIDPATPAAFNNGAGAGPYSGIISIHDATASTYPALVDTITGQNVRTGSSVLDTRGQWISRKIDLTAQVGHTVDQVNIGSDTDANGTYTVLYRNVRFTNGAGTDRQAIWPPALGGSAQSEPGANTTIFSAFASGLKCGPANTFQVYCFTDAGAQVAQSVNVAFWGY